MHTAGSIIGEKYRLEEQIGEGGMASIWRAMHTTLRRPVAIKFVYLEGRHVEARRDRFLREAQLAASIRHRCVVDIVDYGHTDEGQPYMVMELLEGETLGDRFDRSPRLAVDETVRLFDMLMGGLAAIHDGGVVHRDLKPDNIFLTRDDDGLLPKFTDFGISRMSSRESQRPPGVGRNRAITKPGLVLGTPEYMSPEQARGTDDVDVRSDIFSVGVLLYEALSGTLPFEGVSVADVIWKIMKEEPPPLTNFGVSPPLAEVVQIAMAKDPEKRFQNARQVRMAMRSATRLTLADLNDSQLLAGSRPRAFIPLPIAPAAATGAPPIPLAPRPAPGAPRGPGAASSQPPLAGRADRSHADTLSGSPPAPGPAVRWVALAVFAVAVAIAVAIAVL